MSMRFKTLLKNAVKFRNRFPSALIFTAVLQAGAAITLLGGFHKVPVVYDSAVNMEQWLLFRRAPALVQVLFLLCML